MDTIRISKDSIDKVIQHVITCKVTDCNGNPVTDCRVFIYAKSVTNFLTSYYETEVIAGNFSYTIYDCSNELDISCYAINSATQIGSSLFKECVKDVFDFGVLSCCKIVVFNEFMKVAIDGDTTYFDPPSAEFGHYFGYSDSLLWGADLISSSHNDIPNDTSSCEFSYDSPTRFPGTDELSSVLLIGFDVGGPRKENALL